MSPKGPQSAPGSSQEQPSVDSSELFARLYSQHQSGLQRYILMLTGSITDANDVMQETAVVLLQKIGQYDTNKPFMPWAKKVAYYEVLKHRTSSKKRLPLLDEKIFEQVAQQVEALDPLVEARRDALGHCLQKLPRHQLDVIKMRYSEDIKPEEISELTSRPVQTIYTQLKRARQALLECIERTLRREAGI